MQWRERVGRREEVSQNHGYNSLKCTPNTRQLLRIERALRVRFGHLIVDGGG